VFGHDSCLSVSSNSIYELEKEMAAINCIFRLLCSVHCCSQNFYWKDYL